MAPDDVVEDARDVLVGLERAEDGVDRVRADLVPALDQLDELVDHVARLADLLVVALERELVAAQADRAIEPIAERLEHAVADPGELRRDFVRDVENLLHPAKCRSLHLRHAFGAESPQSCRNRLCSVTDTSHDPR